MSAVGRERHGRPGRRPTFDPVGDVADGVQLLEASAGTGKTHTITSLLVRLVAEYDLDVRDALVVTFTRSATAELRERVRTRLATCAQQVTRAEAAVGRGMAAEGAAAACDDEVARHVVATAGPSLPVRAGRLRAAARDADAATVTTIHGFCQRALTMGALDAGVDLDAELRDDARGERAAAIDDLIATELRDADPDWYAYLRKPGGADRAGLEEIAAAVDRPGDLRILPDLPASTRDGWVSWDAALDAFAPAWDDGRAELRGWIEAAVAAGEGGDLKPRQRTWTVEKLAEHAAAIDMLVGDRPRPPLDGVVDKALGYLCLDGISRQLVAGAEPPDLDIARAAQELRAAVHLPATIWRVAVARRLRDELRERRAGVRDLGFDELLRRLHDRVVADEGAGLRRALASRYTAVLVDEFQDTDPVQWGIFAAAFGAEGSGVRLILIGDPKQAIYAFRGADVSTYLAAADGAPTQRTLDTSWRSDASLVTATNALFGRVGAFDEDGIAASEVQAAKSDRLALPDGRGALTIRCLSHAAVDAEPGRPISKNALGTPLPRDVAAEVARWVGAEVIDPDGGALTRQLTPGDIAVLTRTNAQAGRIHAALAAAGIPAVVQGSGSVLDTAEAAEVQRLLDALLAPGDERAARSAAVSHLIGLAPQALVGDGTDEWDDLLGAMEGWRQTWQRRGVAPMLRQVIAERSTAPRLLGMRGGERRLTDLLHLGELLHTAGHDRGLGATALARWLRDARAEPDEADEAQLRRLERDDLAVKVVTIHRSKGLEYPVVLCPYLWEGRGDTRSLVRRLRDADGRSAVDVSTDPKPPPGSPLVDLRARAVAEERREAIRVAYVALTRARHASVVWWGPFNSAEISPLAGLLHGEDGALHSAETGTLITQLSRSGGADALAGHIEEGPLGGVHSITVQVADSIQAARPIRSAAPRAATCRVRSPAPVIGPTWFRSSFSQLAAGLPEPVADATADPEVAARDIDAVRAQPSDPMLVQREEGAGDAMVPTAAGVGTDLPLAALPGGTVTGSFVHEVLERIDFTADTAALTAVVEERGDRLGVPRAQRKAAVAGLEAVLRTPLGEIAGAGNGGQITLADIGRDARLDELTFHLPLAGGDAERSTGVGAHDIGTVLAAHAADPVAAAAAAALARGDVWRRARGYLTGSIDLVARLGDGRILLVDYKTNVVRDEAGQVTAASYHPDRLAQEIVHGDYALQYLLYAVALHRFLRWRRADHDWDRDVAGVAYLFVRGMTGPDVARTDDGRPHGVFTARPSAALVGALDVLLDEGV